MTLGDVGRLLPRLFAPPWHVVHAGASRWSGGQADQVVRHLYLEFASVGVLNAIIATFAPVFTTRLGGTPLLAAALGSGPGRQLGLPARDMVAWRASEHQAVAVVTLVVLSHLPAHMAYVGFTVLLPLWWMS